MKRCSSCGIDQPLSAFYGNRSRKDGLAGQCRGCQRRRDAGRRRRTVEQEHERNRSRRQSTNDWFEALKQANPCQACGEADSACLEFHHVDPTTKLFNLNVGVRKRYGREKLRAEARKCASLCANCHRKLHAGRSAPRLVAVSP